MDLSNVRIREHFGIVTNDTSTNQFSFLVSPPKNRESIEKEDIVSIDHPRYGDACQIIAQVKEITSYEEVAGSTIGERLGKLQAKAQIIGYFDLRSEIRPLHRLLLPPNPGSRVYVPYLKFLEDIFNRGIEGKSYEKPIYLGKSEIIAASAEAADQTDFYLDGAELATNNTLICAIDGVGKTHAAAVIIEELANKTSHQIAIVDPNGEYTSIGSATKPDQIHHFDFQTAIINVDGSGNRQEDTLKKINANRMSILTAESSTLKQRNEIYSSLLNAIARSRMGTTNSPLLLIIEDADNIALEAIEEILSAKDAFGVILLTSHPTLLGGKILSQMQTQIVGKINDPQDLAYLQNVISGSTAQLSCLNAGEWVISGLDIIRPTKIHMRERYSKAK